MGTNSQSAEVGRRKYVIAATYKVVQPFTFKFRDENEYRDTLEEAEQRYAEIIKCEDCYCCSIGLVVKDTDS